MPQLGGHAAAVSKALCRTHLFSPCSIRAFSMSSTRSQLPPESPNYVDYPMPELPVLTTKKPIKGVLPYPRDIFRHANKTKGKIEKNTPDFIARATKEPTKERKPATPEAKLRLQHKAEMAETRRKNLREGLREMERRRIDIQNIQHMKSQAKAAVIKAIDERPTPDDELFTATSMHPSIAAYMRGDLSPRPPTKEEIIRRTMRYERGAKKRSKGRKKDLTTLFNQARTFITNIDDLTATIDKLFNVNKDTNYDPTNNVWMANNRQAPISMDQLLANAVSKEGKGGRTVPRSTTKLAEALAQGKII
ncbi:hypothetical protein EJ05DRAFT_478848 [Pseudovirgaria hyperparasitica]|uniref:Uncharacterized protein n=1 Tax=Pseudovirgaria hyperparasitica TaxID=470096 RepID=A0A6A6VXX5_9PEZI|nr:uncharacterized protein EJ05DRAFT_478848 [Pseudovirgaria hyperparasitica]KAF2755035.1 hypothetical protein EJ05DRAFT_478848 [Pseudovirgaria hyperparasitica]